MSTIVPMYGFGGGGGTGATLTVNAPSGCTVTVSKDGKTKTKTAGTDGVAVFKGLKSGQWTVTITDGEQTAQKTVTITADYSTAITFFSATIHVTYPAGSTCTATDGVTTLTAPDTSGTWDCVVPNAGTWTVHSTDSRVDDEVVSIVSNGQEVSVTVNIKYIFKSGLGALVELSTATDANATVKIRTAAIAIAYSKTTGNRAFVLTAGTIDLSNYSHFYVNANVTAIGVYDASQGRFGAANGPASSTSMSIMTSYTRFAADATPKTYSVDISAVNDSMYVGVAGTLCADITDMWLEVTL